jgi:hypothetical protein
LFRTLRGGVLHFSLPGLAAGRPVPDRRSGTTPDATYPWLWDGPPSHLFSLAPDGVFPAAALARDAVGSYPTFSPLPAACPKARGRRYILCDTVHRRALKRAARACGEARAASCPVVSGLSSPNFSAGAALPAPWDQRTRSDGLAPKQRQGIRDQAGWQARPRGPRVRIPNRRCDRTGRRSEAGRRDRRFFHGRPTQPRWKP